MSDQVNLKIKFDRDLVNAITARTNARAKIRGQDVVFILLIKKLILNANSSWRFESFYKACRELDTNSKYIIDCATNDPVIDAEFTKEAKIYNSIKNKAKAGIEDAQNNDEDNICEKLKLRATLRAPRALDAHGQPVLGWAAPAVAIGNLVVDDAPQGVYDAVVLQANAPDELEF